MSDEYYNHDREGSGFTGLILLLVFMLGGFVVARVHEPGKAVGSDMAQERLAKREKIDSASEAKMAGIDEALAKLADYKTGRDKLIELSIDKDGKYEPPKEVSEVNLADTELIANGKLLFQTKTCFTCHQVDPAIPAPAGLAIKAPAFVGDFWGKEREVHIGYQGPVQKVVRDEAYFIESVMKPMAKVAKGALAPMVLAPGLVNDDEVLALMAYVKSLSKTDD
ncbi:MAG: hypothetical protein CBC62_08695 [Opitutia bacterium TMED102]|nr:hypothetical protein [Verrucomicrobiales bacterium]OUV36631.1 MAG: hypothetical protein CBC62_08695 [Opitutae bacterium TMED102]